MNRTWFRMHDSNNRGALAISPPEAHRWNAQGFGIFWTVNEFNGPRQIPNLVRINAWAVDMDAGTKDEQRARILRSPLIPSLVVETKRGFQVYWNAKDGRPEHWNAIVLDRLVPFFGADPNARDLARILRVPGYAHLKDPANPFMVEAVHSLPVAYTERQIVEHFPAPAKLQQDRQAHDAVRRQFMAHGDDFWERVWSMDCAAALERISGHHAVKGERFTFRPVRNGNQNILVDGKGCSCWIDASGRIGSLSRGGPTLYQWLTHPSYGNSPREAVEVLKRVFPELERK